MSAAPRLSWFSELAGYMYRYDGRSYVAPLFGYRAAGQEFSRAVARQSCQVVQWSGQQHELGQSGQGEECLLDRAMDSAVNDRVRDAEPVFLPDDVLRRQAFPAGSVTYRGPGAIPDPVVAAAKQNKSLSSPERSTLPTLPSSMAKRNPRSNTRR